MAFDPTLDELATSQPQQQWTPQRPPATAWNNGSIGSDLNDLAGSQIAIADEPPPPSDPAFKRPADPLRPQPLAAPKPAPKPLPPPKTSVSGGAADAIAKLNIYKAALAGGQITQQEYDVFVQALGFNPVQTAPSQPGVIPQLAEALKVNRLNEYKKQLAGGQITQQQYNQALQNLGIDPNAPGNINAQFVPQGYQAPQDLDTAFEHIGKVTGTQKYYLDVYANAVKKANAPGFADLTHPEAASIATYTGGGYNINNRLRGQGVMEEHHKSYTSYLNSALDKLPSFTGLAERRTHLTPQELDGYKVGTVVTERAFTSSSKNQSPMAGNARFFIQSKNGKWIEPASTWGKIESEVLFKSGSHFLVKNKYQNGPETIIMLEEVEP